VPNTDAQLQRWLVDPPALVPGTAMPAMGVTPADARDLAAYLRSLR
jgi:cytochrome c2